MDTKNRGKHFDEFTKGLAKGRSRRDLLKLFGAAVVGASGTAVFAGEPEKGQDKKKKDVNVKDLDVIKGTSKSGKPVTVNGTQVPGSRR